MIALLRFHRWVKHHAIDFTVIYHCGFYVFIELFIMLFRLMSSNLNFVESTIAIAIAFISSIVRSVIIEVTTIVVYSLAIRVGSS